ncbi:hypothetical protein COV19_00365 [Candidatus Woesearchaeota archaeon CG10_big_fil_rev_8_21_14_0_10_44_13]|nr:MAG: hypothetical protein COV19_00365 [Candidatus Woesearchaeota archaeon CG10_big_fil_rev_8_21_14_0_10_44_13]
MKCHRCGKGMKFAKGLKFNQSKIDGWRCGCGETYFDPGQAQKILLLNKLKKEAIKIRLGRIRSNLILRVPKAVEDALGWEKGKEVTLRIKEKEIIVGI